MNQLTKQRGFSLLSGVIVLIVVIFFLTCAVRIVPLYINNITVKGALNSLAKEQSLTTMRKREIHRKLNKYFDVNNVNSEMSEAISIDNESGTTLININYEERVPLAFNIDAIITFENQLDVNNPDQCCSPR